ncbi:MAG TPA: S-layer homology domain-containing protein, partial [Bacillota bacterium]|nr:S-layer homology domain-containing protein [Bacillota bacterium]
MKKYMAVVVAIAMVLGLMLPVMAGPFADVPENHWAYEAVKQLAAYGLIEGFPDGTYKGQEPMTRYQMAIVIARLLSDLDTEIIELKDEISSGINAERKAINSAVEEAQNEAVRMSTEIAEELAQKAAMEAAEAAAEEAVSRMQEAGLVPEDGEEPVAPQQTAEAPIIERIIEKHILESEGSIDEATLDAKVAESIALIDAVKAEFAMELAVLGVRVSALEEQLALATERIEDVNEATRELSVKLAQTVSKLEETNANLDRYIAQDEKVRLSGGSKVSFEDVDVTGPGIPWKDPFNADNKEGDADYKYMPTSSFNHDLTLKLTANVDKGIVVEAGLDTMRNILGGGWDTRAFQLKDGGLYLDITTPGVVNHVRVGNVAEPAGAFTDFT